MDRNDVQLFNDQSLAFNPAPGIGGPDWEWHQAIVIQKRVSREDAEARLKRCAQKIKGMGGHVFDSGFPLILEFAIPLSIRVKVQRDAIMSGILVTRWGGKAMDGMAKASEARLTLSDLRTDVRRFGTRPPADRFLDVRATIETGKGRDATTRPFWGGPHGPCLEMFEHGGKNAAHRAADDANDAASRATLADLEFADQMRDDARRAARAAAIRKAERGEGNLDELLAKAHQDHKDALPVTKLRLGCGSFYSGPHTHSRVDGRILPPGDESENCNGLGAGDDDTEMDMDTGSDAAPSVVQVKTKVETKVKTKAKTKAKTKVDMDFSKYEMESVESLGSESGSDSLSETNVGKMLDLLHAALAGSLGGGGGAAAAALAADERDDYDTFNE